MGPSLLAAELLDPLLRQMAWTTLVFVAVLACSHWLGSRAPGLRHGLWGLVLLRLVLPPDLAWSWNLGRVLPVELLPSAAPTLPSVHPPLAPAALPLPTPAEPLWPLVLMIGWLTLSLILASRFLSSAPPLAPRFGPTGDGSSNPDPSGVLAATFWREAFRSTLHRPHTALPLHPRLPATGDLPAPPPTPSQSRGHPRFSARP